MLSTDPSYDNRTIVSTLKMQIRTVQHLRAQLNASNDPLEVMERKDTARKTRTKEFIEKVQAIIDETPQRLTHNCECMCEGELGLKVLIEKTKNLRLIKSVRPPPPLT